MLIEICGIDGSGKSTVINHLKKYFDSQTDYWAYERSFKNNGKRILENIAMKHGHKRAEDYYLHDSIEISNALELVQNINASLSYLDSESNQIFFVDKYYTKWLSDILGIKSYDKVKEIYGYLPKPTLSFYLHVSVPTAFSRLTNRDKGDQILTLEKPQQKLAKLYNNFEEIINNDSNNYIKIDAEKNIYKIITEIKGIILENINQINKKIN